jgi:hypothetical protein
MSLRPLPSPIKDSEINSEAIPVLSTAELAGDVGVTLDTSRYADAKHTAARFVDLVAHGATPAKAARAIGTTLKEINSRGELKSRISKLIGNFSLDAKIQEKLVQAGLTKMFVESVESPDLEERKHALNVAKQLGQNIGLSPSDGTTIDLGALASILPTATLDGIPAFTEVIDVTADVTAETIDNAPASEE